jgi:hypothetical protein
MQIRPFTVCCAAIALLTFLLGSIASGQNSTKQQIEDIIPNLGPSSSRDQLVIEFPVPFKSLAEQYILEDAIIAALNENDAGTFDGPLKALDGSLTHFYIYSDNVAQAIKVVSPILLANGFSNEVILKTTVYAENGTSETKKQSLMW